MNEDRQWKDHLYLEFARIGKCLSSPKRLELIDLLAQGPKSVEQLSKSTGMSVANVSQHLQTLHDSKLVRFHKKGNYVIYQVADYSVADFMVSFHRLSEKQLTTLQQLKSEIFQEHADSAMTLDELNKMEIGDVLLVDVRPEDEYRSDHIPGAVSVPIGDLEASLQTLPADKEIVVYCRGPYCSLSVQAVEILKDHGFRASRIEEGVLEWKRHREQSQRKSPQ
ncbi:metalloregulator ArsR/SmtB family transcription factor [Paenibacillus humicola]|uniref:metalloregulator ArsR/SmtB family transcription factor n=1 Tax=Paenibacillus humicola TaxID=3110540 RepID=UPI00237A4032|nr:metalloregulator ArsR/SmtB family transcription factor [Paenibacillus humicola]